MELILLGHVIGDFYAQTDKVAEKKKNSIKYMLIHCLIYTIVLEICFYALCRNINNSLAISGFVFLSHFIVDSLKNKCEHKADKYEYMLFIADQVIHIIVLFFSAHIVKQQFGGQIENELMINGIKINVRNYLVVTLAALVCWKPTAVFISLVFKIIPETGQIKNKSGTAETEGAKIGSWIGILEREIILMLGLIGQFGAIGFVLTAKSLARFKQLEDKSFAEKYLVGTLLSALIAIGNIVICKFYGLV